MNQASCSTKTGAASQPADEVVGHGRYGVHVTYADGVVRLTLRHVDRKFMPLWLFGRTVLTRMVRLATAGEFEATLRNSGAGLVCDVIRDGPAPAPKATVILGPQWPIDVRESAREQIDTALHAGDSKWGGRFAIVGGAFLLMLLLAGSDNEGAQSTAVAPESAAPVLTAAESAGMSSAETATKAAVEMGTGMPVLEAIAQAEKFQVRAAAPGKRQIIVWSDPLCPNCRDLEQKILGKLPAGVGVTVIPVSFKQGSRPLVSFVNCGQDDAQRAARWADLMSAEPKGDFTQQCETGPAAADRNSVLFARAGLAATPTIMTQDGRLFTGDRTSLTDLSSWTAN